MSRCDSVTSPVASTSASVQPPAPGSPVASTSAAEEPPAPAPPTKRAKRQAKRPKHLDEFTE